MHEDYQFQFCPVCGGSLTNLKLKEQEPLRLVCTECKFVFYLDPKLVACAVTELNGRIVLLRRAIEPQMGKWVIPGGYVDRGEGVKEAAIRETEEECGIKIGIEDLLGVYSYPGRIVVVVAYVAEYLSGELIAGDETLEARLYSPGEIPWSDLAFTSTKEALTDYCHLRNVPSPSSIVR